MNREKPLDEIIEFMPPNIRDMINLIPKDIALKTEEVRLRLGKPIMICGDGWDLNMDISGNITKELKCSYYITRSDINKASEIIQCYSVYSFGEELKNGYITIPGGHRVGIAGRTVIENGNIKTIKDIAFINYRVAREITGAADKVLSYIVGKSSVMFNTLIVSPPQCGKTTLLRDVIRQLSNGVDKLKIKGRKIGLVDERSEIAACFMGEAKNDVGIRTDILDACPKAKGIIMMIRSMSPEIIATDEIGRLEDTEALLEAVNAGVKIIATMHGNSIEDLYRKIELKRIHYNFFERIIILGRSKGVGTIEKIYDAEGKELYSNSL